MKKAIFILFLFSCPLVAQTNLDKTFYRLTPIDTVSNREVLKKMSRIDSLQNEAYFFSDKYNEEEGFFFVKYGSFGWTVYDFNSFVGIASNTSIFSIRKENGRFVSIQTYRSPSGSCATSYGVLFLLDINCAKRMDFSNYYREECYNSKGEVTYFVECKAKIEVGKNTIGIKSSKKPADGLFCIESALYKILEDGLVKISL